MRSESTFARRLLVSFLLLTTAMAGCGSSDRPHNLVLITVDTLRPDHLGFAGSARPTSPVLDALARESVVYENSYSASGWTLPSIATVMTGHDPKDHGATDFHWSRDPRLPNLAGILRRAGYDTHGYVSHVMLTPTYGFGDGFAQFDFSVLDIGHPHDVATASQVTDLALRGLRDAREPYFLWVHYFDPHFEYLEHAAFSSFGKRDIDRYDGEIAHTDHYIGRLLRAIDRDRTVVVFTADHGEEFGEHGGKYHYTLFDEVMRTPLTIAAPGLAAAKVQTPARQIDLLPTMLSLLGVEAPEGLPGRVLPLEEAAAAEDAPPVFIERDRPPPWRQRGVIHNGLKLVVIDEIDITDIPPASRGTEITVENVTPGIYLYDLAADPREKRNIYSEDDPRALEMLGMIAEHFATRRYQETHVELDPKMIEKLRSLGYLR